MKSRQTATRPSDCDGPLSCRFDYKYRWTSTTCQLSPSARSQMFKLSLRRPPYGGRKTPNLSLVTNLRSWFPAHPAMLDRRSGNYTAVSVLIVSTTRITNFWW
jgi:hypothetical protein